MNKTILKNRIASVAYNVIFGAKLHFATYDIVGKVPVIFGITTTSFGIYTLAYPDQFTRLISFIFIVLGLCVWHLNAYTKTRDEYAERGSELTKMFNQLRSLSEKVDGASEGDLVKVEEKLNEIDEQYQSLSLNQQVTIFSNLFAHYKLFFESQSQSNWLVKELNLTFFRDKIPATLKFLMFIGLVVVLFCFLVSSNFLGSLGLSCL